MDAVIDQIIGDFVEKIRNADESDELRSIFESTVGQLGFRYFTYHIVRVPGLGNRLPYVVTTYPDQWVSHYISEGYVHVDPILTQGPKSVVPFSWNDIALPDDLSKKQVKLFSEADDYGIANGMSVPIHGPSGEFASRRWIGQSGRRHNGALQAPRPSARAVLPQPHRCNSPQ